MYDVSMFKKVFFLLVVFVFPLLVSAKTEPLKINPNFPAPEFIRADWLISSATTNYGRLGEQIVFKYSAKSADRLENYRLYEKKPGEKSFSKIANFEKIPSTDCEGTSISGEWMMTEAGTNQCGYWVIQRVNPSVRLSNDGSRDRRETIYRPAADYSEGEHAYYVVGVDKDGLETSPSSEAKLVFLTTVGIFSPADKQIVENYPDFRWSISGGWPAGATLDYFLIISGDPQAKNPAWTKVFRVPSGLTEKYFTYDGSGLDISKKYKTFIFGHYRQSETDPDYISVPLTIPEFSIKPPVFFWWNFLRAFLRAFAF